MTLTQAKQRTMLVSMKFKAFSIGPTNLKPDSIPYIVGGPCAIESLNQYTHISSELKNCGVSALRAGIFKLRTKPNSFQGLGKEAYPYVKIVREKFNLPIFSEVTDPRQVEELSVFVDCFQVGARNMYNYELLKELGKTQKPVLLKRAFSATIDEWVHAAGYIEAEGNNKVILCERGIRTFETKTRNTFDINAISYLKRNTHYPVFADPSHGTGDSQLVSDISLASVAAGADGLLIEVHHNPVKALSDGFQAITPSEFKILQKKIYKLHALLKDEF